MSSNGDVKVDENGRLSGAGVIDNRSADDTNGTTLKQSANETLGWNYDSEHLYNPDQLDLSYHDKINKDPNRVKFAYWVPNVSGGLVISKIPQRTSWELEPNQRYAQTAEQWGFEYAVSKTARSVRIVAGCFCEWGGKNQLTWGLLDFSFLRSDSWLDTGQNFSMSRSRFHMLCLLRRRG